jgi:hypothetical protein
MNNLKHRMSALVTLAVLLGLSFGCSSTSSNSRGSLLSFLPALPFSVTNQANSPATSSTSHAGRPARSVPRPPAGASAAQDGSPSTPVQEAVGNSFLGITYRGIADFTFLFIGLSGTVLGGLALRRLSRYESTFDRYRKEVQQHRSQLANLTTSGRDASSTINGLSERVNRQNQTIVSIANQLEATRLSLASGQQQQHRAAKVETHYPTLDTPQQPSYSIFYQDPLIPASDASHSQPQPSASTFPDINKPTTPQSLAQKQEQVTAAFNSGDRQTIRSETTALLNITSESENAIAMGQAIKTELQEESAGGSFCLVHIGGDSWLYPSEQTLRSFSQYQPSKGIFEFVRQPVHSPQILSPALIIKNGSVWRIEQIGRIAVPG